MTPNDAGDDGDAEISTEAGTTKTKTEYRVKVRATDPSGDSDTATVIINITPENEGPGWVMRRQAREVYRENGTDDVFIVRCGRPRGVRDHLLSRSGNGDCSGSRGNH